MNQIKPNEHLLSSLLRDYESVSEPYRITPYWNAYNRRLVREISKHGINNLQKSYTLLKGFADGGQPQIISPDNNLKRFVFEGLSGLPILKKILNEHKRINSSLYRSYLDLKIKNAKIRLQEIEDCFGKIPFRFDLHNGNADDAFEWNGYMVTAKTVPYLESLLFL